jgi:hypothetical protein
MYVVLDGNTNIQRVDLFRFKRYRRLRLFNVTFFFFLRILSSSTQYILYIIKASYHPYYQYQKNLSKLFNQTFFQTFYYKYLLIFNIYIYIYNIIFVT